MSEQDRIELGPDDRDEELLADVTEMLQSLKSWADRINAGADEEFSSFLAKAIAEDALLITRLAREVHRLSNEVEALRAR